MKNQNYTIKILGLFILIIATSCATRITHDSVFKTGKVHADGRTREWHIPLDYYDGDTRLNYTIANDRENIYLCIRAADKLSQAKILKGGLTLEIELKDKKTPHKISILYPNPPKEKSVREEEDNEMPGLHNEKALGYLGEMQLSGFRDSIGTSLSQDNRFGLNIGVQRDSNGVLVYEAAIPFATFYKPAISVSDSRKLWNMHITLNPVPGAANHKDHNGSEDAGMNNNSGMGGRGAGGMGAGGMNGGGMGGMGGGMRAPSPHAVNSNPAAEAGNMKIAFHPAFK